MRRLVLLLILLPAVLRADQNPLLARWAAEVGGPERVAKIEAVHRVDETYEDGLAGTREEWSTSAMQRRETVDHVHDRTTVVYDGTNGWRRDWNGFVEKLAGSDLRRERDIAAIHTLAPIRGAAGAATAIGTDTLEFRVPGGDAIRFAFDPQSGLPLRAEMPSFDGMMTVAFSDWKTVDGVRMPFTEKWTSGPSTTTVHSRSIELVPRASVDLAPPRPGPSDTFFLRPNATSERVPFNFDNNHIMILTTVNGVGPIWFLVDTGAEFSIINESRLSEFNLTPYGGLKTIGGGSAAASGSYVEHVTYRVGDVELRDQHATVLELVGLEKLYGMPLGGLLGFDFLSRFVVDIDYASKMLILHPPTWDSSKVKGTAVPLTMQGEQPYFGGSITVRGEKIPAWFILDVGAADTITFTTPYVAAHDLLARAGDPARQVRTYAAPDVAAFNPTNVRGLIDSVDLGGFALPHVFVNLSAAKAGAYTSPAFDGNIGETILSRFPHVILDYRRSVMVLVAGPDTAKPFEERRAFGLTVVAASPDLHHITVTAVGANSPAAAAGFQKGDVIAAVDGTPAEQLTLARVQWVLRGEGTHHEFVVMRSGERVPIAVTVTLIPISSLK